MSAHSPSVGPPGGGTARRAWPVGAVLLALLLALSLSPLVNHPAAAQPHAPATAAASTTLHVSVTVKGTPATAAGANPAVSHDGRFVAFESRASNLVASDANGATDVFVRDLETGATALVSVNSAGQQANGASYEASISADGRRVIFTSKATNLIGKASRFVAPRAYRGPGINVFLHDRQTGKTIPVSVDSSGRPADRHAWMGDISPDGGFVTFSSHSENLVKPDKNGIKRDPFIHDLATGVTEFVDLLPTGVNPWSGGSISAVSEGGRFVAYRSKAPNLVPGDTNTRFDIFVIDRSTYQTRRVSVASDGRQGTADSHWPDISADGRFVAFETASALVPADNNGLIDIYVHDRQTGATQLVSGSPAGKPANGNSTRPKLSADGRFVAFSSLATNLVPNDTNAQSDVFVHDRVSGETVRASVAADGSQAVGGPSTRPAISGDGRSVAFVSTARNLVAGVSTTVPQIYVRRLGTGGGEVTYTIAGIARDGNGNPLPGVTVATDAGHSAITGDNGRYTISGVPAGSHRLTAVKDGYRFEPAERQVTVPPDATGVNFTGTAIPTYSAGGLVADNTGAPLAGVVVSDGAGRAATTGADGRYTLAGLPEGTYTLSAAQAGYVFEPATRQVTVPPDATGADFTGTAIPTYSAEGIVLAGGAPLAGVVVSDGAGRAATTGADGRYTLAGLPEGTHTLSAAKTGYVFEPATRQVTVPPGATGADFAATVAQTYSISGTVKRADGTGIQSAVVSDGQGRTTSTNFRGQFTLEGLPPGTYTITVTKNSLVFTPASRVVTVPPNATGQNFTGK